MMESSLSSEDFSDTIFWFLHENSNFSSSSSEWATDDHDEELDQDSVSPNHGDKTAFWHGQHQQLQATLCRTTRMESRIRQATEEALRESPSPCTRRDILERLCRAGFDCSIRSSKWNKSSKLPAGEHTYLEVVEADGIETKGMRVIVELNLRAEFEMTTAGAHYNRLVSLVPEVYVGMPERMRNVVKILCGAAKKCMKEKNMHMPPWRKLNYMESKWFSTSGTNEIADDPPPEEVVAGVSADRLSRRPKASMLTFALLRNLPQSRTQFVAVV